MDHFDSKNYQISWKNLYFSFLFFVGKFFYHKKMKILSHSKKLQMRQSAKNTQLVKVIWWVIIQPSKLNRRKIQEPSQRGRELVWVSITL